MYLVVYGLLRAACNAEPCALSYVVSYMVISSFAKIGFVIVMSRGISTMSPRARTPIRRRRRRRVLYTRRYNARERLFLRADD